MKQNKNKFGTALKTWLKDLVTKNVLIKIVSLVFAMLLWGYVLTNDNPVRTKTVTNVPVTVQGEADLIARKFVLCGDKDYGSVNVKVSTRLTDYVDLDANDISASISLSNISEKGEYQLKVKVQSSIGEVISTTPETVTVKIDRILKRSIPIELHTEGELKEGLWSSEAALSRREIEIEGAAEDMLRLSKAVCTINLDEIEDSISKSVLLTLLDDNGEEMSHELFYSQVPSVTVRMEVLSQKTVPIDVDSAIMGKDEIPINYELVSYGIDGDGMVTLVGDEDELNKINSVGIDMVSIAGRTESEMQTVAVKVPEGVRMLNDNFVSLYVSIREKTDKKVIEDIPIEVINLGKKLNITLSEETAELTLYGRVTLLNAVERGDVRVYIDAEGLTTGVYPQTPIVLELPQGEITNELISSLNIEEVTVTIH